MKRTRRLLGAALAVLAVVLVGDFLIGTIAFEPVRRRVEARLSETLGLEVRIQGDFQLNLIPRPRFEASRVTVQNLPGRVSPYLAEIGTLELELDLLELLTGGVEVEELEIVGGNEVQIETDAEGRFELKSDIDALVDESAGQPVDLQVRNVRIEDLQLSFVSGRSGSVNTVHFDEITLESEGRGRPIDLTARGEFEGGGFDVAGRFGSLSELQAPTAPYPVSLRGRILGVELEAKGSVEAPTDLRGVEIGFSAELADLAEFARGELPRIGPIAAAGRLSDAEGPLAVRDLAVRTEGELPVRIELTGSVNDLLALQGVEIDFRFEADDPRILEPLVERPLSKIGSLEAAIEISDQDGSLGVEGRAHAEALGGQLSVDAEGGLDDLGLIDDIDVRLAARARDLGAVGTLLGLEPGLPAIGPVTGSGRIRDHDGAVGIDEVVLEIGSRDATWARVQGSVGDLFRFEGVGLEAAFTAVDLRHLKPYLEREPPDVGPIRGTASLTDRDGSLGVERFQLRGGRRGVFEIDVSGELDDVRAVDEIAVRAKLDARDLSVVGDILDLELPPIGPVSFAGQVQGSDERVVSTGTARLDETALHGRWSASFPPGARPSLEARIESPHIRLEDVGVIPRARPADGSGTPDRTKPAEDGWWSSAEPLPFEQLRALDAQIELRADRVTGREGFGAEPFAASLALDDGKFTIREAFTGYERGRVEAELSVDARTPVPSLALRGDATGIDLTRLMSQLEEETEFAGLLDLALDLESRGRSVPEIRSNLSGRAAAAVREGAFASRYASEFLREMAFASIPSLRGGRARRMPCFALDFAVEEGVATADVILLQSPRVRVTGEGDVDIGEGAFDLLLTPEVLDPSLLSIAATVTVIGPLEAPTFSPVRRSLATSALRAVRSNALRPVTSLFRSARNQTSVDEEACRIAPAGS